MTYTWRFICWNYSLKHHPPPKLKSSSSSSSSWVAKRKRNSQTAQQRATSNKTITISPHYFIMSLSQQELTFLMMSSLHTNTATTKGGIWLLWKWHTTAIDNIIHSSSQQVACFTQIFVCRLSSLAGTLSWTQMPMPSMSNPPANLSEMVTSKPCAKS